MKNLVGVSGVDGLIWNCGSEPYGSDLTARGLTQNRATLKKTWQLQMVGRKLLQN